MSQPQHYAPPQANDEEGRYPQDFSPVKAEELPVERRCTCGRVFFWCLWIMLFLVLLLGALALILYFIFQPQAPQFDIVYFSVANMSISTSLSTVAAFYLDAVADFTLAGYNPNRVTINYDYINMTVFFQGAAFGNSTVPAFTQGPESSNTMNSTLVVSQFPLTFAVGPTFLSLYNSGTVPFQVVSLASAHINILGIAAPSVGVQLTCNVTINLTSSEPASKVCSSVNVPLPSLGSSV